MPVLRMLTISYVEITLTFIILSKPQTSINQNSIIFEFIYTQRVEIQLVARTLEVALRSQDNFFKICK